MGGDLTSRQREVVQLSANGKTAKQVARALGLSSRTVQDYLRQARRRTGAASTLELVALAVSAGIVSHDGLMPASPLDPEQDSKHISSESIRSVCKNSITAQDPLNPSVSDGAEKRVSEYSCRRPTDEQPSRPRGRPTVMTPSRLAQASELLGSHTIADIATLLGVSRRTLYMHMMQIRAGA